MLRQSMPLKKKKKIKTLLSRGVIHVHKPERFLASHRLGALQTAAIVLIISAYCSALLLLIRMKTHGGEKNASGKPQSSHRTHSDDSDEYTQLRTVPL